MWSSRFLQEALNGSVQRVTCYYVTKREQEVIHKHYDGFTEQGINALVQRHHTIITPENWIASSSARTWYSPVTAEKPVAIKRIKYVSLM